MITCGRQLPLPLSDAQQNEVGHWVPGSTMPRTYDAVASSVEMQAKKRAVEFFQHERELVAPGEFRRESIDDTGGVVASNMGALAAVKDAEMEPTDEEVNVPTEQVEPGPFEDGEDSFGYLSETRAGDADALEIASCVVSPCRALPQVSSSSMEVPGSQRVPVQVEHDLSGRLHLYHAEIQCRVGQSVSQRSVCGKWVCGQPSKPTKYASFLDAVNSIVLNCGSFKVGEREPCGDCFSASMLERHQWKSLIPSKDELVMDPASECSPASSVSSDDSEA